MTSYNIANAFNYVNRQSPIIVMSPHSGINYSHDFMQQTSLSLEELRESEDCHVNRIFANFSDKYSSLTANFPRVFVDVNRSPLDIDPDMWLKNNLSNIFYKNNPKVIWGIGVFHRVSIKGNIIYENKLPIIEARRRLFEYYFPYHKKIKEMIKHKKIFFDKILALDFHSMSSKIVSSDIDIVLSNGDGKTCDNHILKDIKNIFIQHNYNVLLNKPFKGGFISHFHSNPKCNIHIIQVEINKKVYMCEKTFKIKKKEMIKIQKCFNDIISKIYPKIK